MFLGLLDPDPSLFCTDPDPSTSKKVRQTLISTIFCDFLSMTTDVNVGILSATDEQKSG